MQYLKMLIGSRANDVRMHLQTLCYDADRAKKKKTKKSQQHKRI